jgi:hypothetical protein
LCHFTQIIRRITFYLKQSGADIVCGVIAEGSTGMIDNMIEKIGDHLAKQEGYANLRGINAVHRYLIDKYGWQPEEVRKLSPDDMQLLLDGYEEKAAASEATVKCAFCAS